MSEDGGNCPICEGMCCDELTDLRQEIREESAITFEDPRLTYVTVQITRSTWEKLTDELL